MYLLAILFIGAVVIAGFVFMPAVGFCLLASAILAIACTHGMKGN